MQLFESIAGSVVSEWHLSLWNSHLAVSDRGPLILKTDRHRSVQGWRGWRGPQRGHTQDRTGFSNSTLWRQLMDVWVFVHMGFIAEFLCFHAHFEKPSAEMQKTIYLNIITTLGLSIKDGSALPHTEAGALGSTVMLWLHCPTLVMWCQYVQ